MGGQHGFYGDKVVWGGLSGPGPPISLGGVWGGGRDVAASALRSLSTTVTQLLLCLCIFSLKSNVVPWPQLGLVR